MTKRKPIIDMAYQEFGAILLDTLDLDPVYVMLVDASLPDKILKRFLLAYWCYYHCGVAALIAESEDFYEAMWWAYGLAPRGMERRYFYGSLAEGTIAGLEGFAGPEHIVEHMCDHLDYSSAYKTIVSYYGFGKWMAWKVADMAERVLRYPVDFSNATLSQYKDPIAGAALIMFGDRYHPITDDELKAVCAEMIEEFSDYLAPPWHDRPVNIQECETVLCKFKAHCYGSYPLGRDTVDIGEGLVGWCDLADELHKHLPEVA